MSDRASRSPPAVSVVYPTCGRPQFLMRSIRALVANDPGPGEIVVVDQSRSPETRRALSELGDARILHMASDERGLSRAKNLGIRSSRLPIIAFLDDDCVPAGDWVRRALDQIEAHPEASVWIGKVVFDERELPCPERHETYSLRGVKDPWRYDPTGGNSFFRRTVFDRVGAFDPLLGQGSRFPGAEDGDMIYRVLKSGVGVTYTNTIRCFHIPWRNTAEKLDNRYNYGSGVGAMLAKYTRRGELGTMAFIFVRHFLKKFLLVPYHRLLGPERDYQRNLTYCRGLIDGFVGWKRLADAGVEQA